MGERHDSDRTSLRMRVLSWYIQVLIVAFQVSEFERRRKAASSPNLTVDSFLDVFGVFVNGAFVPVMVCPDVRVFLIPPPY